MNARLVIFLALLVPLCSLSARSYREAPEFERFFTDKGVQGTFALLDPATDQFDPKGDPPGWRGTSEDTLQIYDGLTIQIFTELLQTQKALPDFTIPSAILNEIPRQLGLFAERGLSFPVNGGEFFAQYTRYDGTEGVGRRLIKYLWHPWVIDCSVRWLEYAEKQQSPREQRVQVRRALGHLVVDLGDEALKRAQGDYTFFASENLYGLTVIDPPRK